MSVSDSPVLEARWGSRTAAQLEGYFQRNRLTEFALVAAVAAVILAVSWFRTAHLDVGTPAYTQPSNHHKFIYIATHGLEGYNIAPFCHRILMPLLVRALPLDIRTGFILVSLLSVMGTSILCYYIAKKMGWPQPYPLMAMLLFLNLGWHVRYTLWNFWNIDPLLYVLVAGSVYALLNGKYVIASLLLALGVATKEVALLALPLFFTLCAKSLWDWKHLRRAILMALPPLLLFVSLQLAIPRKNNDAAYVNSLPFEVTNVFWGKVSQISATEMVKAVFVDWRLKELRSNPVNAVRSYTTIPWGVALVLPFLAIRRNRDLFIRFSPLILAAYALLVITSDTERLLTFAFLPAVLLSLNGLGQIVRWTGIEPVVLLPLLVALPLLSLLSKGLGGGTLPSLPFDLQLVVCIVYIGFAAWRTTAAQAPAAAGPTV